MKKAGAEAGGGGREPPTTRVGAAAEAGPWPGAGARRRREAARGPAAGRRLCALSHRRRLQGRWSAVGAPSPCAAC